MSIKLLQEGRCICEQFRFSERGRFTDKPELCFAQTWVPKGKREMPVALIFLSRTLFIKVGSTQDSPALPGAGCCGTLGAAVHWDMRKQTVPSAPLDTHPVTILSYTETFGRV